MDKMSFTKLMGYPSEWVDWGMYPDELFAEQIRGYEPGHEEGSEHDRYGAFHWWIKKKPTPEQVNKLFRLAELESDRHMAADVVAHLKKLRDGNKTRS